MKDYIIAILFTAVVIYIIVIYIGSALVNRKIRDLYLSEKYDEYLSYLDSKVCRMFIKSNEVYEHKYKLYLKKNDRKHIDEYFDTMLNRKSGKDTKLQYQIKAFYYYMQNNGANKCKQLLEDIRAYGDENVTKQVNYLYEIVVLHKGDYIDELKALIEKGENVSFYEYVLSVSYENIGDARNAKKYKKSYKDRMTNK